MQPDREYIEWRAEPHAVRIRYLSGVMESMRRAAMEGLQRIPRRGLEIGGVLFGRHKGNVITISEWRPIHCEHAAGPGFELSASDQEKLQELFDAAAEDPELGDLEVVGWFRSRTRDGVCLEEADVRLYDDFFPAGWHVVLVMRPHIYEPAQAGFFFREADGTIQAESSYHEFTLENTRRRIPLGFDPSRPLISTEAKPAESSAPPETAPAPRSTPPAAAEPKPAAASTPRRSARRKRWTVTKVAAAVVVVIFAIFLGLPALDSAKPAGASALNVRDVEGQLVVEWNRAAPVVREARSAFLRIADGDRQQHIALTKTELTAGSLTYQRQSGDVRFSLVLETPEGRTITKTVHFRGPAPVPVATASLPADTSTTDALRREADRLRGEIEKETQRNRQLRDRVAALERSGR